MMHLIALLALGCPELCRAAQDGTIVTAASAPTEARDITFSIEGGELVVDYATDGGRKRLKGPEVVEVSFKTSRSASPRPDAKDVEVHLTSGDVIAGRLGARSEEGVPVASKVYGNLVIKFEQVRVVYFPANSAFLPKKLPEKVETDLILKKTGDRGEGTLLALSDAGVEYRSKRLERDFTVPLPEIAGVWIAAEASPKEPATLFSTVLTSDGSAVRGQIQSLAAGALAFKDLYGRSHKIGAEQLAGLYMKNGLVVYLSDLDPVAVQEEANYIRGSKRSPSDLEYPFQRDRSAKGTRLVTGAIEHRKGLGVRAHSSLTYALGGAYKRFQATFGLDAISGGLGAVTAEAWVDGKKLFEHTARRNDPAQSLDLDVGSAKELKLVVTWAGHGQSDFADWGSARLIR
jgi:hypothetical protein